MQTSRAHREVRKQGSVYTKLKTWPSCGLIHWAFDSEKLCQENSTANFMRHLEEARRKLCGISFDQKFHAAYAIALGCLIVSLM